MFRSLVLGAVQGLTEFVPISSSGHLVLVPFVLAWPIPDLAFDVAVHLGTALAVLLYFARDLWAIASGTARTVLRRPQDGDGAHARLALLLVVGSVPAAVAGILLEGPFEALFTSQASVERIGAPVVAVFLVGTAALMALAELTHGRRTAERRDISDLGVIDAVAVGLFQALAIAPGLSRSGATISAGIFRGLSRDAAARFSFLLGLPAIAGAGLVALPDLPPGADLAAITAATGVSAATGFLAIAFLLRYLRTRSLRPFSVYCLLAAAVALGYWFQVS